MLAAQRKGLPSVTHTEPAHTACGVLASGPRPYPAPGLRIQSQNLFCAELKPVSTRPRPTLSDSDSNGSASQESVAYRTPPRPLYSSPDLIQ